MRLETNESATMSGQPNSDLAVEQQQPGDPSGYGGYVSAFENGMGSEMPEAPRDKFFRKMKEQPLVPIGKSTWSSLRLYDLD